MGLATNLTLTSSLLATDGALVNGCFLLSTGICFRVHLPLAIGFSLYYLDRVRIGLFGKTIVKFQEAFIATLLLVTCVEIHRAAMTTRVDMLLTTFIVIGLFQLYRWEDKLELKGLPIFIPFIIRMRRSDQRTGRRSIAPIRIRHLSINVRSIQLSHHIQDFIICGNFLFIPTDVVVYRCMEARWR